MHNSIISNSDKEYWRKLGEDEIQNAFRRPVNWQFAKNVIVMVCDGMDPNTITAARIYKETERGKLAFEQFPHVGLLKVSYLVGAKYIEILRLIEKNYKSRSLQTYSANKKVPDSAAAATALFTGVKTNNEVVGVDARVRRDDCMSSLNVNSRVQSIMEWAIEQGKNTGNSSFLKERRAMIVVFFREECGCT